MAEAVRLIRENRPKADRLVEALMQKNKLSEQEIAGILEEEQTRKT